MTRIQILAVAAAVLFDMPTSKAQDLAALQSDLTVIQSEIKAAQTEDARYAGGLVKTLITARILILSQTEAMLKQKL